MQTPIPRPEFVVVGGRHGDGVVLLASSEVDKVSLDAVYHDGRRHPTDLGDICAPAMLDYIMLGGQMRSFVWVYGDDYAGAFAALQRYWNPDALGDPRLEGARVAALDTGARP